MRAILSSALSLRVIIAVVFGLALLGAVLALENPSAAWRLMVQVGWQTLLPLLFLIPLSLAARAWVWRQMLAAGGVQLSWPDGEPRAEA